MKKIVINENQKGLNNLQQLLQQLKIALIHIII